MVEVVCDIPPSLPQASYLGLHPPIVREHAHALKIELLIHSTTHFRAFFAGLFTDESRMNVFFSTSLNPSA